MRRREFVVGLGAVLAAPLARGQAGKLRRIGVLGVGVASSEQNEWARLFFLKLLRDAGYEVDQNLAVEWRHAEGDAARLPALAEELIGLKVELIVASFNQSIAVAQRATRSIPIVMLNAIAPVEQGFVASLARPGGNITGTAWSSPETMGKILEVLKEAAPRVTRLAVLGNPNFPGERHFRAAALQAGSRLGMALEYVDAARPEDIAPALERVAASKAQALFAAFDTALLAGIRQVAEFTLKRKLISMSTAPQFVDSGGLLYYGPDINEIAARTVSYVVRILGGAHPADLPVELPSRYQMIVSQRTAKAIGHRIPPSLLARADRVIE
jgi:putative ABC transport system substrate-binding protein